MVCISIDLEATASATVYDANGAVADKTFKVTLDPSKTVQSIYQEIEAEFQYEPDSFELMMQTSGDITIFLSNHKEKTFQEIGDSFGIVKNAIFITPTKEARNMNLVMTGSFATDASSNDDDDLLLGASASPTANTTNCESKEMVPSTSNKNRRMAVNTRRHRIAMLEEKTYRKYSCDSSSQDLYNYVGLVNQAMTCYLNSLLQALYMTPEFRNALYKWKFVGQQKEADSIPFQLQKLFLNLQTSSHSAVETKELTQSFGWDLSEAWQQHDIQELCRVMFDALEQTFKETKQANLINDLYEGKMIDYVKCLECNTEKSREDTFLDIPLPVRPFESSVAYNSVEEALRAFVQPETLDGNNQYHCEKCNKKCDAHKGLKFKKFPYLLTLHLKRFDFDYSTLHRIKLNDKVVFPEILNLNSFIPNASTACNMDNGSLEEHDTIVKCDDCSTTDSGSALDDESCQGTEIPSTINGQEDNYQDEDEGIDVSSENHHHENEKNRQQDSTGPYIYELFSIMIHSGSASGGHYYAYIKDFQKNMWFCFNDSSVTHITQDDIQKTYGGGLMRTYYSGAYSSSTNAYMLMYRQIDSDRNDCAMQVDEFPEHIQELLQKMRNKEQCEKLAKEREYSSVKMKVYCFHPVSNQLVDFKLLLPRDTRVVEATKEAYECLKLEGVVALDDCRLVSYNKVEDVIEFSFGDDDRICDIAQSYIDLYTIDWLLEIKQSGTEFQIYKPGGVTMKVCYINLEVAEIAEPFNFRVQAEETVGQMKLRLAKFMNMDSLVMKLVQQDSCSSEQHYLDIDDNLMDFDHNCKGYKLYVAATLDSEPDKPFIGSKFNRIIERFSLMVTLEVILPETDIGTLESLSIPSLDLNQNLERVEPTAFTDRLSLRSSPQPACEGVGDQSNSEDSSLSDSDRTLVGDAPGDCLGLLSSSNSPADQHMVSPLDPAEDTYDHDVLSYNHSGCEDMSWEDDTADVSQKSQNYYFKASSISHTDKFIAVDATKCCTVYVDRRMTYGNLKKHLEPIVGVPTEYFKLYKYYSQAEIKFLNDTLNLVRDGERVIVKLGRVLKKDEFSGKIYHLTPESNNTFYLLFDWIIAKDQTVGQVKKEILFAAKKQHMLDIHFGKSRLRNKNWKNPGKIFLDDQQFGEDIPIKPNWEMFLQDLGEEEKVTKTNQLCLFVKRWCPSLFTLTPFHEVVLDRPTMDELKDKLAAESQIPKEFVDVLYIKGNFPCDINILEIHEHLEWNPTFTDLESCPLQVDEGGCIFLYRDSREILKPLTAEEKKEINQRENIRLRKFSSKFYSPKKERALRIYFRSSHKSGETSGD